MLRLSIFKISEELQKQFKDYRDKIENHLKELRVSPDATKKILGAVDKIPVGHIQVFGAGALAFLTELTDAKSRCKEHYAYSDNLAEFFCTITNIGFLAVAFYYHDYAALLAGTFSALSHAIPLKRLNDLDKLAAIFAVAKVMYRYDLLLAHPSVLMAGMTTMACGGMDLGIRYGKLKPLEEYRALVHCAWHLSAAFTLRQLNYVEALQTNIVNSAVAQLLQTTIVQAYMTETMSENLRMCLQDFTDSIKDSTKLMSVLNFCKKS